MPRLRAGFGEVDGVPAIFNVAFAASSCAVADGLAHAGRIQPLDENGNPTRSGKIVMISVGMSNTSQTFCAQGNPAPCESWSFVGQSNRDQQRFEAIDVALDARDRGSCALTANADFAAYANFVTIVIIVVALFDADANFVFFSLFFVFAFVVVIGERGRQHQEQKLIPVQEEHRLKRARDQRPLPQSGRGHVEDYCCAPVVHARTVIE